MATITEPSLADHDVDGPLANERISLSFDDHSIVGSLRSWDGDAEIELERPAPTPLPRRGRVQYFSSRGIVRQHGSIALAGARDSGRRIRFAPSGTPQLLLARQHLRAELTVPVVVCRSDGTELQTVSLDLSESGALLEVGLPLAPGEHVELQMRVERFAPAVLTSSVVVRVTEAGHAAVHHTQIDRPCLERLCWRIFNHLLHERSERRGR